MTIIQSAALVAVTAIMTVMTPRLLTSLPQPQVFGSCTEPFKEVERMFRSNIETGRDYGGAFSVYHKGSLVCDLWGGWADMDAERSWGPDTISILFSATKGISALCVALLRDRGLLDYDSLVSEFWPEFGQAGKKNITIRMLLSHQAGLAAITTGEITYAMIRDDPEAVGRLLAEQPPNWPPGEKFGYHALTFGLYVDHLIRRVDPHHRSLDQFFQEEVAMPFDLDLSIGLPLESHHRVARIEKKSALQTTVQALKNINVFSQLWSFLTTWDTIRIKAFQNPADIGTLGGVRFNWPEYQQIPFGSISGYGTARALARLYGILADGGKLPSGHVLLSPATIAIADTPVSPGPIVDAILGAKRHWGYGFQHFEEPGVRNGYTSFGHTGYGGQLGFANTAYKAGWAYITNHPSLHLDQHEDTRIMLLEKVLFETLRKIG